MNNIPEELYLAYKKVVQTNFEDDEVYAVYEKLAKECVGEDRLNLSRLVVNLTKAYMEIEEGYEREE